MLLQDMLQKEIGEELGCTQSHVSILKKRALKKIGKALQDAQWDGSGIWDPESM